MTKERLNLGDSQIVEPGKGVAQIASSLGAAMLAERIRKGGTVEIPFLGIIISSADLTKDVRNSDSNNSSTE